MDYKGQEYKKADGMMEVCCLRKKTNSQGVLFLAEEDGSKAGQ